MSGTRGGECSSPACVSPAQSVDNLFVPELCDVALLRKGSKSLGQHPLAWTAYAQMSSVKLHWANDCTWQNDSRY